MILTSSHKRVISRLYQRPPGIHGLSNFDGILELNVQSIIDALSHPKHNSRDTTAFTEAELMLDTHRGGNIVVGEFLKMKGLHRKWLLNNSIDWGVLGHGACSYETGNCKPRNRQLQNDLNERSASELPRPLSGISPFR